MADVKFEIEGRINLMNRKISSHLLKVGDRFFYPEEDCLFFKTTVEPIDGKYMCCNDAGLIKWLPGNLVVFRLNGVSANLRNLSRIMLAKALKEEEANE